MMEEVEAGSDGTPGDGRYHRRQEWRLPEAQRDIVPLMYSIKATKQG